MTKIKNKTGARMTIDISILIAVIGCAVVVASFFIARAKASEEKGRLMQRVDDLEKRADKTDAKMDVILSKLDVIASELAQLVSDHKHITASELVAH